MQVKLIVPAGRGYTERIVSVDFNDLLDVIKFTQENAHYECSAFKAADDLFVAVGYPDRKILNGKVELTS
jgi:hypothetical protein